MADGFSAGFITPGELHAHDWNESGSVELYDLKAMLDPDRTTYDLYIPRRFVFWYRFRVMLPAVLLTFFSFSMETFYLIPWYVCFFFKYYKFTVWCKSFGISSVKLWIVMILELILMLWLFSYPRPYVIEFLRWQVEELVFLFA